MTVSAPEQKTTMNERVYQSLRSDILAGRYPDGAQLLQKDLADKYDVSRIPVREALMQLSSEGLVKLIPYKGAVVAAFSLEERHESFDIRYALESLILRHVVERITDEDAQFVRDQLIASTRIPAEQISAHQLPCRSSRHCLLNRCYKYSSVHTAPEDLHP